MFARRSIRSQEHRTHSEVERHPLWLQIALGYQRQQEWSEFPASIQEEFHLIGQFNESGENTDALTRQQPQTSSQHNSKRPFMAELMES